jgi:hypothetical protein
MAHASFDPEEPTNYPDIRESFALALEEEAPEAKEAVLGTVDDAIGVNAEYLHFPGDRFTAGGAIEPREETERKEERGDQP